MSILDQLANSTHAAQYSNAFVRRAGLLQNSLALINLSTPATQLMQGVLHPPNLMDFDTTE